MPSALPTILRRIQDQDDAPTLGAGQDGYALTWDNSSSAFVATALAAGVTINDGTTTLTEVWSSLKTSNEIGTVNSSLSSHTSDLTPHRIINDGSTAATVLWSASKINAELASKGGGDFKADGSVAMTGSLNLAATATISTDADVLHTFGRASVGFFGSTDYAGFAHRDRANVPNFALLQRYTGETILNASSGQLIYLRNANVSKLTVSSSSVDFIDTPIVSTDGDTSYDFGRTSIGYDGTNSDRASFAHRDRMNSGQFALSQDALGHTYLNSSSTRSIYFSENSIVVAEMTSSGLNVTGEVQTDTLRIDQTPVAETPTPTHTIVININGTVYRIPCLV